MRGGGGGREKGRITILVTALDRNFLTLPTRRACPLVCQSSAMNVCSLFTGFVNKPRATPWPPSSDRVILGVSRLPTQHPPHAAAIAVTDEDRDDVASPDARVGNPRRRPRRGRRRRSSSSSSHSSSLGTYTSSPRRYHSRQDQDRRRRIVERTIEETDGRRGMHGIASRRGSRAPKNNLNSSAGRGSDGSAPRDLHLLHFLHPEGR